MSKKFEHQLHENIEIIDISSEGAGVAKINNWVVFVEGAVPGDVCNISIYKKKKSFGFAKIKELVKPSSHRVEAPCHHFGTCGGCKWQNFNYTAQLEYKQNQVVNAFQRLAKVEVSALVRACWLNRQKYGPVSLRRAEPGWVKGTQRRIFNCKVD